MASRKEYRKRERDDDDGDGDDLSVAPRHSAATSGGRDKAAESAAPSLAAELAFASSSSSSSSSSLYVGGGGAFAYSEVDASQSADARALLERSLASQGARVAELEAARAAGTHAAYRGQAAYTSFVKKDALEAVSQAKARGTLGPARAPTNVRGICRVDYQPDVCKDFKETGVCGFGDSCKFLHDRSDYQSGWQIELEWQAKQKRRQARLAAKLAAGGTLGNDDEAAEEAEEAEIAAAKAKSKGVPSAGGDWATGIVGIGGKKPAGLAGGGDAEARAAAEAKKRRTGGAPSDTEALPHACFICRAAFRNPVQTQCGHCFCESCAVTRHRTQPLCAVCGKATHGIFNSAPKLAALVRARAEAAAAEVTDKGAGGTETGESGAGGWGEVAQ